MKREEPWQKAKRQADDANLKATIERRTADIAQRKATESGPFNPLAIAWGDVSPPPPRPETRTRKPRSRP